MPWGNAERALWQALFYSRPDFKLAEELIKKGADVNSQDGFFWNTFLHVACKNGDSDIVMFLLRREYYDPMDKPGMAELIIAKNRHGSVGSVQLTFRKEIAQFANYTPVRYAPNEMDHEFAAR